MSWFARTTGGEAASLILKFQYAMDTWCSDIVCVYQSDKITVLVEIPAAESLLFGRSDRLDTHLVTDRSVSLQWNFRPGALFFGKLWQIGVNSTSWSRFSIRKNSLAYNELIQPWPRQLNSGISCWENMTPLSASSACVIGKVSGGITRRCALQPGEYGLWWFELLWCAPTKIPALTYEKHHWRIQFRWVQRYDWPIDRHSIGWIYSCWNF